MSDPYVGEVRIFGGNFAPVGWAFCWGQSMPIAENDVLFTLIGTTYGGDGQETFNLPNLAGRVPMHQGQGPGISQNYVIGEAGGVEQVTLTSQQMPVHNHPFQVSSSGGNQAQAAGNVLAAPPVAKLYRAGSPSDPFPATLIQPAGGNQPHENMQPYIAINYIISLYGVFPTQS